MGMLSRASRRINMAVLLNAKQTSGQIIRQIQMRHARNPTSPNFDARFSTSKSIACPNFNQHQTVNSTTFIDESNVYKILNKYDTFLVDCDGVLWGTDHFTHLPSVATTISKLRRLKKHLLFVTNNSIHAREDYIDKFRSFAGFDADMKDVFCVAYSAAVYLKDIAKVKGKCYVIGSPGMKKELENLDIPCIGYGADLDPVSDEPSVLMEQKLDPQVDSVLVGFDINFGYNKLYKAASYLTDQNCQYVATNDVEVSLLIGPHHCQPLTGAIVAAISATAKRSPAVIGKPHSHLMECIMDTHPELDLKRTLMIGDSLKTDVAFAKNSGINSALVLSGAVTSEHVNKLLSMPLESQGPMPTYVLPSISFLGEFI